VNPRLTIILIGIVVLPLAIAGWLVGRTVRDGQAIAEQRFRRLASLELAAVNDGLDGTFARIHGEATAGLDTLGSNLDDRRGWSDDSFLAAQLYVLGPDRRPAHPPIANPTQLSRSERDSLERTQRIWDGGALASTIFDRGETAAALASDSGWFTWYWEDGIRWIAWRRDVTTDYAIELERTRVLSEIINDLPDTRIGTDERVDSLIRLRDASNRIVYQWGQFEPDDGSEPVVRVPATEPLTAWNLEYYAISPSGAVTTSRVAMLSGLIALIVAVSALAIYFHREQSRDLREAGQRVNFVNQVSHELKTPLTNIRMYAELMSDNPAAPDAKTTRHLGVIISESRRLSRLINNVLTLGGKQQRSVELRRKPVAVDDVVRTVLDSFRPALEASSIEVHQRLDATEPIAADPDRLEQIVGNLVSNVEKYAADGRYLGVRTRIVEGHVEVSIEDRGRGIHVENAQRIFEPFYRVDDSLTEGVSGTGIGLSIARDLARLHGGDLYYEPTGTGSRFRLEIPFESARA